MDKDRFSSTLKIIHRNNTYLYIAIFATLASTLFWTIFVVNTYNSFGNQFFDLGMYTYSFYFTIHYPNVAHGLQALIYGNHISIDQLFVLPIFYIWQSGLTLLLVQDIILNGTAILIFLVTRKVAGNEPFALALCIAYLLNPGMHGLLLFDYHPEFLIIPFYILAFYFYMNADRVKFILAFLLLTLTIEIAALLGITFGLGMLYYNYVHAENKKIARIKKQMAIAAIAISLIAFFAYFNIEQTLLYSYPTQYANLPPYLRVVSYSFFFLSNSTSLANFIVTSLNQAVGLISNFWFLIILALFIGIFNFGFTSLREWKLTAILTAPWIFGVFSAVGISFLMPFYQYYSYVIGASIVSSLLGFKVMLNNHKQEGLRHKKARSYFREKNIFLIILISMFLLLISIGISPQVLANTVLFKNSGSQATELGQVNYVMKYVSANASLMVQSNIFPHVFSRRYIESPANNIGDYVRIAYFKPDYILIDNSTIYPFEKEFLASYMKNNTYYIAASNGSVTLYKEASP